MKFHNYTLDHFQIQAVQALARHESVVVSAATGTGKTLIADYATNLYLEEGKKVIYTAPIKALSNQKFKQFTQEYGADRVGLLTGDIVINPRGDILIMTVEIYRNMLLVSDPMIDEIACVVFDEIHFINDEERGMIWEESIIFSPDHVRFVCLSATIPNAKEFAEWISKIKKHPVRVITHDTRPVPLEFKYFEEHFGMINHDEYDHHRKRLKKHLKKGGKMGQFFRNKPRQTHTDLLLYLKKAGKLPGLFFVFSRAKCELLAREMADRASLINQSAQNEVEAIIDRYMVNHDDILALKTAENLFFCLKNGVGFHHAGILPRLKQLVEELFEKKLLKVIYATETFAVGINMPTKTVIFFQLRKYDGVSFRYLKSKEFYQMAGRAGRRGLDTEGLVVSNISLTHTKKQYIDKLNEGDIEPICSQFKLSYNTVVNLIRQYDRGQSIHLLKNSFFEHLSDKKHSKIPKLFDRRLSVLKKLKYLNDYLQLTPKGFFLSKVYTESLSSTELFTHPKIMEFSDFERLFLATMIVYEPGKFDQFETNGKNAPMEVITKLGEESFLYNYFISKKGYYLYDFLKFWFDGGSFLELTQKTSLLEGDIIRLLRMTIDLLFQVLNASESPALKESCRFIVHQIEREYIAFQIDVDDDLKHREETPLVAENINSLK